MGTYNMLKRSISYEEALLKNYRSFASRVEAPEIQTLYSELVREKDLQIKKLKKTLDSYCKPCRAKLNKTRVWTKDLVSPNVDNDELL